MVLLLYAFNNLYVDVSYDFFTKSIDELEKDNKDVLERIQNQLMPGYVFKNEKEVEDGKRDKIDSFLDESNNPTFQSTVFDVDSVVTSVDTIYKIYGRPKNIIVIGNGGSISSLKAYYAFLADNNVEKDRFANLYIIDSQDPDYIKYVNDRCSISDTLVCPISKSGNTQGVLDCVDVFSQSGYNLVALTQKGERKGKLYDLVSHILSERGLTDQIDNLVIEHPPIGGRYVGSTLVAAFPLALLGFDRLMFQEISDGLKAMYKVVNPKVALKDNPALKLSCAVYDLEMRSGIDTIFSPMYSKAFDGFQNLITQLLHESSCKAGVGQTILTSSGPECQHHTNQRFFGGKKNMCGIFFTLHEPISSGITTSDNLPLDKALMFEYGGTLGDAKESGIDCIHVMVDDRMPTEAGKLMAFCQYAFGVYPSLLRDVNPFDQPQVENSKIISRELRKNYKK